MFHVKNNNWFDVFFRLKEFFLHKIKSSEPQMFTNLVNKLYNTIVKITVLNIDRSFQLCIIFLLWLMVQVINWKCRKIAYSDNYQNLFQSCSVCNFTWIVNRIQSSVNLLTSCNFMSDFITCRIIHAACNFDYQVPWMFSFKIMLESHSITHLFASLETISAFFGQHFTLFSVIISLPFNSYL